MLLNTEQVVYVLSKMSELIPNAESELQYADSFQMLTAVILSAQSTDKQVNKIMPGLFERFPDAETMGDATPEEIEPYIQTLGLYRNKAKFLQQTAYKITTEFNGIVPGTRKELMSLPGVGRKTANVVLSVVFNEPAIAVDTHVERVSKRLRFVPEDATPSQVEKILMEKIPKEMWSKSHQLLVLFGRYYSTARSKECFEFLGINPQEL